MKTVWQALDRPEPQALPAELLPLRDKWVHESSLAMKYAKAGDWTAFHVHNRLADIHEAKLFEEYTKLTRAAKPKPGQAARVGVKNS